MSQLRKVAELKLIGSFVLMTFVLGALTILAYHNSRQNDESSKWVAYTNEILYHSEKIISSAIDIETGQRGYLITGDRIFLEHYEVARKKILTHIQKLKTFTKDNPVQQKRMDTLAFLTKRRIALLGELVNVRSKNTTINETMTSMSYESKSLLDKFRIVLRNCQEDEKKFLELRIQAHESGSKKFYQTLAGLIISGFVILFISFIYLYKYLEIRDKNEQIIQQNWKLLESVLDNINAGIYIKDLTGKYLLVNKKMARQFGKDKSEIFGHKMEPHVNSEVAQKQIEKDELVITSKIATESEESFFFQGNTYHTIYSRFSLLDDQNNVTSICGVITDISEIKQAQEILTYQSSMIQHASDAFIGSDLDFTITYWNKSAEQLYGISVAEAIGKNVFKLLNTNNTAPENISQIIFDQIKENGSWQGEFEYQTKNGRTIPISTSTSFIKNNDGEIVGILAINRDITERVKQQESIVQLNKELEAFTYSVSHDLRAPLRAIDGYARILLEDHYNQVDDDGKKTIQIIVNNAVRMGKLIDDLLTFSRTGRQDLLKRKLNMQEIVHESLNEFENGIDLRYAQLKIGELPNSVGDLNMIRQVWTNLISNALKYSSKKPDPIIEIGGYSDTYQDVYYITDNGAGFDMQYAHKLFGVFQRLHHQEMFGGTGVGLALVQRIISKHAGKIWAESEVDQGATFYFSLPKNL